MLHFKAQAVAGAKRGRAIGLPTINLDLASVPADLKDGIYACRCRLDAENALHDAVMHLGPRPVFKDVRSCEIHLLDADIDPPLMVEVLVDAYLREVCDFPSVEAMMEQIETDISQAREVLTNEK
jgi:riboflavin kinase / FMN adenylyltransferase